MTTAEQAKWLYEAETFLSHCWSVYHITGIKKYKKAAKKLQRHLELAHLKLGYPVVSEPAPYYNWRRK